jgi:hypothetical protein
MKSAFTSLFRTPRLLLALTPLAALPLHAADPAALLPDESVAYMEMDSQAIYKLEEHRVAKTLPLEKLKDLFYKIGQTSAEEQEALKKRIAEATGVSYDELEKKFGRFALSIHDLDIPANPTPETVGMEFSAAYEFDGDEELLKKMADVTIEEMIKQVEKQGQTEEAEEVFGKLKEFFEHSTVEHEGAKIHVLKLKDTDETKDAPSFIREWAYSVHEKMIVAASGVEQVEEMLGRLKSGSDSGSLAASAYYKKDKDKAGKPVAIASLNLKTILGLVEKYALPMADSSDVDVEKVWKALGADKLESAALALGVESAAIDITGLLSYSDKPGILSFLAIPGSGSPPSFLPKDIQSGSYQQIDLEQTIENLEKLAGEIHPQAGGMIQMGLTMAQQQLGVDLKKDLLGQLGPDTWTASAMGDTPAIKSGGAAGLSEMTFLGAIGGKAVTGIRVKDSKAFALALDSVINKVAQKDAIFSTREYQGFEINEVKESPEEMRIAYVLTDEWLILSIGGGELLEKVLGRLGKTGDDGFFAQKSITSAMDGLRGSQAAASVTDVGAAMSGLFQLLEVAMEQAGGDAPEVPFDELGKLLNVPLWSVEKAWIDDTHAEYRSRIVPKE